MRKREKQGRTFRTQSILGLLLGAVFLGFGIFIVLPEYGSVGYIWMLLAVFIILVNFRTLLQSAGKSSVNLPEPRSGDEAKKDPEESLMELYRLYNRKVITKEEYTSRRERILKDLKDTDKKGGEGD